MPNAIGPSAILLLAFFWVASPADAEVPRTGPQPSAGNEQVQKLVDELRALTDEADRNRTADPRFLRDLRGLARRYDYPFIGATTAVTCRRRRRDTASPCIPHP